MLTYLTIIVIVATTALARLQPRQADAQSVWNIANFQNLITFGDSYTDENRLSYLLAHNGTAPPPGLVLPESFNTAGGGRTWPRYVVQYTGETNNGEWEPQLELYDYAVSGAVCSNLITPRVITPSLPGVLFPSVLEYEVPTYAADLTTPRVNTTNTPVFTTQPTANNSVYALWIGTNDLGVNAFLTNSQAPNATLTTYTSCIYDVFDALYITGARTFVLINTIPLELTPLYANATLNGTTADNSQYWPDKPANTTAVAEQIREYTSSVNSIFQYQTPYEALVANRYPNASWALFDVHAMFEDMYRDPAMYLNGTESANVSGFEHVCDDMRENCVDAFGGQSADSFLWYDPLHPSEQTDRNIAREFIAVVNGTSQYATYY